MFVINQCLQCLSLSGLSRLALCFWVRPRAYPRTKYNAPLGSAPALHKNIKLGWKGLPETRDRIHNPSFYSELKDRSNKLECYITLGWKSFPVTNTLSFWACSQVKNKIKGRE